jgi:hypothetical protein
MPKTKKMNESAFAKIVKEADAVGESIRSFQDEKQAVMNDFAKERKRYARGKISKATLASSARKSNKEIKVLDKDIRKAIKRVEVIANQAKKFVARQKPKTIRASTKGVKGPKKKKKKVKKVKKAKKARKKAVKKARRKKARRKKK